MPAARAPRVDTREQILTAAAALFAERGFHGTTAREIAQRAGVNLASAHYHFGSKEDLYLEVLRVEFDDIMRTFARRGARLDDAARPGRAALERLLHARIAAMLEVLLGPPPGRQGTLLLREMCDPSAALPHIIARFVEPMKREMEAIIARLAPTLPAAAIERCAFSVVGQVFFYRTHLPVLQHFGEPASLATLAGHIATFSLAGLRGMARRAGARRGRTA